MWLITDSAAARRLIWRSMAGGKNRGSCFEGRVVALVTGIRQEELQRGAGMMWPNVWPSDGLPGSPGMQGELAAFSELAYGCAGDLDAKLVPHGSDFCLIFTPRWLR